MILRCCCIQYVSQTHSRLYDIQCLNKLCILTIGVFMDWEKYISITNLSHWPPCERTLTLPNFPGLCVIDQQLYCFQIVAIYGIQCPKDFTCIFNFINVSNSKCKICVPLGKNILDTLSSQLNVELVFSEVTYCPEYAQLDVTPVFNMDTPVMRMICSVLITGIRHLLPTN